MILDFAHNEAGAGRADARRRRACAGPAPALHVSIGNAGDRTDEGIARRRPDRRRRPPTPSSWPPSRTTCAVAPRSRSTTLQRAGMRCVGKEPYEEVPDEPSGLRALLARARDGDVLAMMIHQDRAECVAILRVSARPRTAATIAAKAPRSA